MYQDRQVYRRQYGGGLATYRLTLGETDLAICLPPGIWSKALEAALSDHIGALRRDLLAYMSRDQEFASTHSPYLLPQEGPPLAQAMAKAAALAGVGPMATVAGAFAQAAGIFLASYSPEVIVENGGDIYLSTLQERIVGVYAGESSPFHHKLGLKIGADAQPLGICTSSGRVGPSFSYGRADAAVILAKDTLLADGAATAAANRVLGAGDVEAAAKYAAALPGVGGALILCDEALAAWGQVELVNLG